LLPLSTRAQLHFFLFVCFFSWERRNMLIIIFVVMTHVEWRQLKESCCNVGNNSLFSFVLLLQHAKRSSLFIVSCCYNACEGAC
jgi:hypothetical protein